MEHRPYPGGSQQNNRNKMDSRIEEILLIQKSQADIHEFKRCTELVELCAPDNRYV